MRISSATLTSLDWDTDLRRDIQQTGIDAAFPTFAPAAPVPASRNPEVVYLVSPAEGPGPLHGKSA